MPDFISTPDNISLKKMLDVAEIRHKYITNNIANADNEGYISKNLDFRGILQNRRMPEMSGMSRTSKNHIPTGASPEDSPFQLGGAFSRMFINYKKNSEEEEMVNLASNTIAYRSAADIISRKYLLVSTSITGGR